MARVVLINMGLFLLPFVIYTVFRALGGGPDWRQTYWSKLPVIWLTIIGFVLVFGMLLFFIETGGDAPGGVYVPPAFKDGVIVPGHAEPKPTP